MTERQSFSYSVLRYHHDLETDEFVNVGLVVYSGPRSYLRAKLLSRYGRITNLYPGADGDFFHRYITHLQTRLDRVAADVAKKQLPLLEDRLKTIEEILASVLPVDEASIRFGPVRTGVASDLDAVFEELYDRHVARYLDEPPRPSRSDDDVWEVFRRPLQDLNVMTRLRRHEIVTPVETYSFEHSWKNGAWNVLEPVSFDLMNPTYIRRKAREWFGTLHIVEKSSELSHLYLLLGKPGPIRVDLVKAYGDAKTILAEKANGRIRLVEEDEAAGFAGEIGPLIEQDTGKESD